LTTYQCPQGETLKTTGRWHKKADEPSKATNLKYRTPACKACPVRHLCTSRTGGREIDMSMPMGRRKQQALSRKPAIVSLGRRLMNIFWNDQRQWGYNHTNLIGLEKSMANTV
jgi:hypothetical protein